MTTPTNDAVAEAFRRARAAAEPQEGTVAPPIGAVRRQGALVKRSRGLAPLAAVAAVLIVGGAAVYGLSGIGLRAAPDPATTPSVVDRSMDDVLLQSDLGGQWKPSPADRSALSQVLIPGCVDDHRVGQGAVTLTVRGDNALFRGVGGGKEWLLDESVFRLSEQDAQTVGAQLRRLAGCATTSRGSVFAASESVLIVGRLVAAGSAGPVGALGSADAYGISGSVLVRLSAREAVGNDETALSGQTRWLLDALGRAVTRATGSAPALPAPNDAAEQAAAAYARHPQSTADQASDQTVPPGFLTLADLGTVGAWSVSQDVTERTSGQLSIEFPSCRGRAGTIATGYGTEQAYRGWTTGTGPNADRSNAWPMIETVVRLDAKTTAAVRIALDELANCTTLRTGLGTLAVRVADGSRVVLVQERDSGEVGSAVAWVLRGTTLVALSTQPGDGRAALPGGLPWFTGLVEAAQRRAT